MAPGDSTEANTGRSRHLSDRLQSLQSRPPIIECRFKAGLSHSDAPGQRLCWRHNRPFDTRCTLMPPHGFMLAVPKPKCQDDLRMGIAMRSKRKAPLRTGYSIVRPDGGIVLPVQIQDFEIGQRVFFHVRGNSVAITARPQRSIRGRFLSCRVRRAVRSFSIYGPRAAQSPKGNGANHDQLRARKLAQS